MKMTRHTITLTAATMVMLISTMNTMAGLKSLDNIESNSQTMPQLIEVATLEIHELNNVCNVDIMTPTLNTQYIKNIYLGDNPDTILTMPLIEITNHDQISLIIF